LGLRHRPRRSIGIALRLLAFVGALLLSGGPFPSPTHAATLPSGFTEIAIFDTWDEYAGVTFDEVGAVYAWDRKGRVWIIENDVKRSTPLVDISEEVGAWDDYGLLSVVFHPNFRQNGYVYLLYVVDHHHLAKFGTPSYNPSANEYHTATIGRITRYTARASDSFHSVDPASRLVLVGETASAGFPIMFYTHGVGSLLFGADGSLIASCGDGAALTDGGSESTSYYAQALSEGIIRPKENIGGFRAQMVDSLSGKLIRLDPATGNGLPSNPFYDSSAPRSPRSRVYALGLRNPCRVTMRPGTGSHLQSDGFPGIFYIGDVGYFTWEELSVCTGPGLNFGWPIFEGYTPPASYADLNPANQDAPNPLFGTGGCNQQYFTFRDLLKEASQSTPSWPNPCKSSVQIPASIPKFVHTRPAADWMHGAGPSRVGIFSGGVASTINIGAAGSPVSGPQFGGNCSIGGTWYTGTAFPAAYRNTYFHGELGNTWIKSFNFDANNKLVSVQNFADNAGAVVFIAAHPTNGSLYYVSWTDAIRKITYVGSGNRPPTAVASANVTYGPGPLTVQFTGTSSSDPDGQSLTYRWNFGDGSAISTLANPSHTFTASPSVPTRYDVTLTVTDTTGLTNSTTLLISVNNTPPHVAILSPANGSLYSVTAQTVVNMSASVSDAEQSLAQLSPQWQVVLHHNTHIHTDPIDTNWTTSATLAPLGCDGDTYFYRITLVVTDAAGLTNSAYVDLFPNCGSTNSNPNTPPTLSDIANQTISEDGSTGPLTFSVSDAESLASSLGVSGTSSNPTLVPNANLAFAGSGALRSVNVTPAANQSGSATITVTVNDGQATASDNFVLTVNPVNDPPTLSDIIDQTVSTGGSTGPLGFTVGDPETAAGSLTLSGSSSNPTLVPNGNIAFGGSGANRTVTVSPAAGQTGTATITVSVSDGVLTASDTFVLTVSSVTVPTYLLAEGFEGTGFENTGWSKHGTPNADYTNTVLVGAQSLSCVGAQYLERPFTYTNFFMYFRVRWPTWSDYKSVIYWDDANYNVSSALYADDNRLEIAHGNGFAYGTTTLSANVTYHIWLEWSKGGGNNGSMKMFISTTGTKPASPEAIISNGTGGTPARMYFGPTATGPSAIFDQLLVDDVAIGSNPGGSTPNTPPSISNLADLTVNEDVPTSALAFTVGDTETAAGSLALTGTSSNPTLVPNGNIAFGGSGANRTVTVTPAANQFGSASITLTVSDGALTASDTFVLTVTSVNDLPTISDIPNQSMAQNGVAGPLNFTIGDIETAAGSLTLSGTSSNPTLVPNANIAFGGSGSNRTVTITPATGQSGTATINVTVSDGTGTASDTLLLTVAAGNSPPTISDVADLTVNEDTATSALPFTVGDAETATASLTVTRSSSNPTLVPTANILLGGSGANRTVTVTPAANQFGAATITLTVSDGSLMASDTFVLNVASVNDLPTISDIANQSIAQNGVAGPLNFTVGDIETAAGSLTLSGTSSNPTLVPNGNIAFGGTGSNRTVTITPAPGQSGTSTITVIVSDGTGTASDTLLLTVAAGNTPPTISDIPDQTVNEETATAALAFVVGDLETAAASLTVSGSSSNPTLVPNANIVFGGSGANRTVRVTPATNQFGSATITVTASDGTLAASDTFVLTVASVNDLPTISNIADLAINQDTSTAAIPFTIGDVETAAASLTVTATSSNPTLVPNGNIGLGGSGANRTITVTPAAAQFGTATLTVTVSDGAATATDTFVLTVNNASAPTYLLTEGFEGTGFENSGWINHGTANPDYTNLVLHGSQSLNCSGARYIERPFAYTSFNLYFRVRWVTWSDYNNIIYWDDSNYNVIAGLYADDNKVEIVHGANSVYGTTALAAGVTYHVWVEWTKGTGSNGTMKLYISSTGTKPTTPEATITNGTGGTPARIYLGPTLSGPNAIFDRILVDDVPIGSNP
jgi:glucose/arabinose dehydrogenase